MKKLAIAAMASLLLISSAPVQAQSLSVTIGTQDHRYEQRRDHPRYDRRDHHRYDRRDYERRERRFYSQQPTYWRGRCRGYDIVVRDPYTNRMVCANRDQHRQFYREFGRRY